MIRPKLLPWLLTPSILTVSIGFAFQGAHAAEHTLMPSPQTVHFGYFSAALKPVLTINSGDILIVETVSGVDPEELEASRVAPASAVPDLCSHDPPRRYRPRPGCAHPHRPRLRQWGDAG